MTKISLLILAAGVWLLNSLTAVQAKEAIYANFSKLPLVEQPQVSPDGQQIAAIFNTDDGPQVVLMPFGTIEYKALAQLKKSRDRVDAVRWSGNQYLIVAASYPEYYRGKFFRVSRLYRIDVIDGSTKEIVNKRFTKYSWYNYQSYLLTSALKYDPEHILVSTYDELDSGYSVFKVNLKDGGFDKVMVNSYKIDHWAADRMGVVRVGVQVEKKDDQFISTIWYRPNAEAKMQKMHSRVKGVGNTFDLIGLNDTGDKAYVLSDRETGRQSLWLYNIISGEFESMLFGHERYDIDAGLVNSQGELIGAGYYDDFFRSYYFDEKDQQQEKLVQSALKGLEVSIVSQSQDKTRLLVRGLADNRVPTYYYFDLASKKAGAWLSQYPQLARTALASVENIQFSASDGQVLTGYLTIPKDVNNPPLIVYPHGGPHSRDYKYFDPELQYFAAKGYAVLQVNFRGSEGFGSDFETAGYFQWGKRMQQDVYDGMDWVLKTGRVSQDKACLVGGSYGGYVALTAAFQQPKRFDCIVSIAGISDLREMVDDEERQDSYIANIVDINDDKAKDALDEVSAIRHIQNIEAPILLIHGTKDTRVNYNQSADFYSAARKKLDVKYIEIKNGTHFFDDSQSRKLYFSEMDKFLSKYL